MVLENYFSCPGIATLALSETQNTGHECSRRNLTWTKAMKDFVSQEVSQNKVSPNNLKKKRRREMAPMEVESTTSTVAFHNQGNCCVTTRPTEKEKKSV